MKIRQALKTDFLEIAALDRVAWGQNRNSAFIPDGEHAWRLWVEHALVYCCVDNDTIIGAVLSFPCLDGQFCLHKVMVDHEHRGRGIGSRLFEEMMSVIDIKRVPVFLTVDPVNKPAIALYEKWGFSDQEYVKGYYRADEDRLVLTRRTRQ